MRRAPWWNWDADEPVSFENGVWKVEFRLPIQDHGVRLEAARRDRDVVARSRDASHLVEIESVGHHVFLRSTHGMLQCRVHYRGMTCLG